MYVFSVFIRPLYCDLHRGQSALPHGPHKTNLSKCRYCNTYLLKLIYYEFTYFLKTSMSWIPADKIVLHVMLSGSLSKNFNSIMFVVTYFYENNFY